MYNPIQNMQTVPTSESVSSGCQTISIPMTERNMHEIQSLAAGMNMSIRDYIISAGYYNPMVLQMEQIKDFTTVWENCISILTNVQNGFAKEMLLQAFMNLYSYIESLLPNKYLNISPAQCVSAYMNQPSALTANETQVTTSFQLEVPDHLFQLLKRYAELMKVDLSSYLLYSAIGRVYVIPSASFEIIFLNLRNIGYLLDHVSDFDLRDLLLENIAPIWHMFCNAMVALEVHQYQSYYIEYFPRGESRLPVGCTSLLP